VKDRNCARDIIKRGYVVVYDPDASAYHHHGILQGRDEKKKARVVQVIEVPLIPLIPYELGSSTVNRNFMGENRDYDQWLIFQYLKIKKYL